MHYRILLVLVLASSAAGLFASVSTPSVDVGVARIDITPDLPIRLSGYASRQKEAERAESRLYARAVAIGSGEQAVVLVSVETARVSAELSAAVAAAVRASHGIERSRVAVCATHIHTGPVTHQPSARAAGGDGGRPRETYEAAERYTHALQAKLETVARGALEDRQPAQLAWGQGTAQFATNRRRIVDGKWVGFGPVPTGSADRGMPVLRAVDKQGNVRAILVGYACHCTTLMEKHVFVHSDWAGDASGKLEAEFPEATALVLIGCAGDADPYPRGSLELVSQHGSAIFDEVRRLLASDLQSVGAVTDVRYTEIDLPFERHMTREDFVARVGTGDKAAQANAQRWIERVDAGTPVPAAIAAYPVQSWSFGSDLAMVFLGGEVASEYSLRLKRELGANRLWVSAYANSMPTYIPSKQMWDEGGYEVDLVADRIGFPARLARDTEDRVVDAVHKILPAAFTPSQGAAGGGSRSSP